MKRNNNAQSAYLPIFRARALNAAARIIMPGSLRKAVKQAIYAVELPLFEIVKCSKQLAWKKYCNRFIGALRAVVSDSRENQKIISILERNLKGVSKK